MATFSVNQTKQMSHFSVLFGQVEKVIEADGSYHPLNL